jgi:hypothetical protein
MRKSSALRAFLVGIPLVAGAAMALTGCVGGATDPAEPAAHSAAGPEVASAAKASAPATDAQPAAATRATTEVAAPESTQAHEPIDEAEAAKMIASIAHEDHASAPEAKAGDDAAKADLVRICPACFILNPDLTVVEDDRDQELYDPTIGWYGGYAKGFDVKNLGPGNAGTFHVAVLQGSYSYGFDVPGLAAGASIYFQITTPSYLGPACGDPAVVLLNPFNAISETNYNNNAVTIDGYCFL